MKKSFFTLFFATFATAIFSQTSWTFGTDNVTLNPSSANVGIGGSAIPYVKLNVYNDRGTGFRLTSNDMWGDGADLCGVFIDASKKYSTYGTIYGLYSKASIGIGKTDAIYGTYSIAENNDMLNESSVFGIYTKASSYKTGAKVYGIYSSVISNFPSGPIKYSGYFEGGKFVVMDGKVGIGTEDPIVELDVKGSMAVSNNVGIGTTTPSAKLDVKGSMAVSDKVGIGTTTPFTKFQIGDIWTFYDGPSDKEICRNTYYTNGSYTRIKPGAANLISLTSLGHIVFQTTGTGAVGAIPNSQWNTVIINNNGNVGIGTTNPTAKLDVIGIVRAYEVKVCLNQGCDFVFDKDYKLMPLSELSSFITENKHLPEIAPAAEMESEGINLSEMNAKLLQKVEELTLYVIDLQKQIDELKK